jgi:DNA modification methylase
MVPVLVTDLSEEEAEKVLLTLDPLAAMATANKDHLQKLLASLKFESKDVAAMLEGMARDFKIDPGAFNLQGQTDPDEIPAPPDDPVTQPGDLWILGDHRLLCGDGSKAEDVDRLLGGAPIHLVNTDPPYNVRVEPRSNNAIAAGLSSFEGTKHHQSLDLARYPGKSKPTAKKLRAKDRPLTNDFVSEQEFEYLLDAWFGNIARVLIPGRAAYIWGGYANCANYPAALKKAGLYFSQAIIWDKEHPVLTRKDFMGAHEWCFYCWREGAAHQFFGPNNATDLWRVKKVSPQTMVHLTEKPVELAVRALQYSSRPGENVLDLFAGSGSTLIGAEQTGRRALLMELDPLYCDVIVARWERFVGKRAER